MTAPFQPAPRLTGDGLGGGIAADGGSLVLNEAYLDGNQAEYGGAISLGDADATLMGNVNGTVLIDNSATIAGGGIDVDPYDDGIDDVTLQDTHFWDNQAPKGASVYNEPDTGSSSTVTYTASTFATQAATPASRSSPELQLERSRRAPSRRLVTTSPATAPAI